MDVARYWVEVRRRRRRFWEEETVCAKAKRERKNVKGAGDVSKERIMKVLESLLCWRG